MIKDTNGAWRVVALTLVGILQMVTILLVQDIRSEQKEQRAAIASHAEQLAVIHARHYLEDKKP